jgi:Virulence factor
MASFSRRSSSSSIAVPVPELTVISWRDIPAQVTAGKGRQAARAQLSERFQEAIDAAAMRAGLIGSDGYLEEWRRTTRPCGDDLEGEVAAAASELELEYTDERLERLVRASGEEERA